MNKKKDLPNIYGDEFLNYLQEKGRNHQSYKMYSTIDLVNSTIDGKALYLSNGHNWNDVVDRENFNNDELSMMNFGRCFSFSSSESVAMWMLYGGMKHRGAMIEFDKASVLEILNNTEKIDVGYFINNRFETVKTLMKNEFEIKLIDIVYTERKNTTIIVRRSTGDKWLLNEPMISKKSLLNQERYTLIHKSKAWDYEQECRLIISISKDILRDLSDYNKAKMVRIDLHNINLEKVKRRYAPNVFAEDRNKPEFINVLPSTLLDEVDWDLCLNCK